MPIVLNIILSAICDVISPGIKISVIIGTPVIITIKRIPTYTIQKLRFFKLLLLTKFIFFTFFRNKSTNSEIKLNGHPQLQNTLPNNAAKILIERWRQHYNHVRLHGSLGYRPPAPEAIIPSSPKTILYAN